MRQQGLAWGVGACLMTALPLFAGCGGVDGSGADESGVGENVAARSQAVGVTRAVYADYDGDKKADQVYSDGGVWHIWQSKTGTERTVTLGEPRDILVPGDYDGDGRYDPAVYSRATRTWTVQLFTGAIRTYVEPAPNPIANVIPVPGDYDGDGTTDYATCIPDQVTWIYISSRTGARVVRYFASEYLHVVPADYDGDGKTDIAIVNRWGQWRVQSSLTGSNSIDTFGGPKWRFVPADYDGDGRADMAGFDPDTGLWKVRGTLVGNQTKALGGSLARQVPADYDGNGLVDLTAFNPDTGQWQRTELTNSAPSAPFFQSVFQGGAATHIPTGQAAKYPSNKFLSSRLDFDGDGKDDLAVLNRDAFGALRFKVQSSLGGQISGLAGSDGDIAAYADYDGDGISDFGNCQVDPNGYFKVKCWIKSASGSALTLVVDTREAPSVNRTQVAPMDSDGDGKAELVIFDRGRWYDMPSGAVTPSIYDMPGDLNDVAVPGDFDGDGRDDFASFSPTSGVWKYLSSHNGQLVTGQWGALRATCLRRRTSQATAPWIWRFSAPIGFGTSHRPIAA